MGILPPLCMKAGDWMNKYIKTAVVILTAVFLCSAAVYAYFSDTLKVTNHISVGTVDIGLEEYGKKGGTEVKYRNPETILPGAVISKIPRIINYAMPCWVRARISFENKEEDSQGLDETMIAGFSDKWIKRGEYYYCREILKKKESVDLFQTVSIPADWDESHEGQDLGIVIRAEAIQAANFTPDFNAMSPWGDQEIQQCIREQDGVSVCTSVKQNLSVELNGDAHKLIAVPGDFFSNMGTAMPGDVFEDTVMVSNTTDSTAEILFRTAVENRDGENLEILEKTGLSIYLNGQRVYRGNLASPGLEDSHSLGIYQPGQTGNLKFVLEIPEEWDNSYAMRTGEVQWIFSVNEQENENAGPDGSYAEQDGGAVVRDTETEKASSVKTDDMSQITGVTAAFFFSGTVGLGVWIYRKRRRGL